MVAHSFHSSKHLGINYQDGSFTRIAHIHYWQERLFEHVCSDESVTVIKIYSITLSLSLSLSLSHRHACLQPSLWENQTKYIIQDWQRQSAVDAHCVCTRGSFVTELRVVCVWFNVEGLSLRDILAALAFLPAKWMLNNLRTRERY